MVIAVDFDGTLCDDTYPQIGKPITKIIKLIQGLHARGDTIILYTCRTGERLEAAVAWCKSYNVPIDYVNENVPERTAKYDADCRKISADIYIDDKTINFSTYLEEIQKYLKNGEPIMSEKKTMKLAEICINCIHKDLCKYHDKLSKLEAELKIEEPFGLTCKHKNSNSGTITQPSWISPATLIRGGNQTNSICSSCGFLSNGECKAPSHMVGLPCQTVMCSTESSIANTAASTSTDSSVNNKRLMSVL